MKSEDFFRVLGEIDDAFIQEAEESERRRSLWVIIGAAAAIAVVAIGTVWFASRLLNRPVPGTGPPELAAPVVSTEPNVPNTSETPNVSDAPDETTAPAVTAVPDIPNETPVPDVQPSDPVPDIPNVSVPPTDPDQHDNENTGQVMPGWGGSGWSGGGVSGSGVGIPGLPSLPGMASLQYRAAYFHSAAGDYLVFSSPILGIPVVTENITGKITDGYFAGTISGFPFGEALYVELHVNADGSYEIIY